MRWIRSNWPFGSFVSVVGVLLTRSWLMYRDWMWNHWPSFDTNWTLPFGTLTDVVGIIVGLLVLCLTLWIARRQIKIMNKQTAMMGEQGRLARKQARLTQQQHHLFELQLSKRANPILRAVEQAPIEADREIFQLELYNDGNGRLDAHRVELIVAKGVLDACPQLCEGATVALGEALVEVSGQKGRRLWLTSPGPIFPGTSVMLGHYELTPNLSYAERMVEWAVYCDLGEFPESNQDRWVQLGRM